MKRRASHQFARVACAVMTGLAACQAGPAFSATFSVNPTQVFFSAKATNALVTLRNESDEAIRFQLSVFAWSQAPDGQMKLAPTQDIIFFPQLLTLAAHEERKIRVGTTLRPEAVEKTYRLFVEELPPSQAEQKAGAIRVLMKMGIPIFLRAAATPPVGELQSLREEGGRFSFVLANKGVTHFVPESVTVKTFGPQGEPAGEQAVKTWYILAGSIRVFEVDLPKAPLSAVIVEARVPGGGTPLTARLELSRGAARD